MEGNALSNGIEGEIEELRERISRLENGLFDRVTVERLILRRPGGPVRALLALSDSDTAMLTLHGKNGDLRIAMSVDQAEEPAISLYSSAGQG